MLSLWPLQESKTQRQVLLITKVKCFSLSIKYGVPTTVAILTHMIIAVLLSRSSHFPREVAVSYFCHLH